MSESKSSPIATRVIAAVLSAGAIWALAEVPGLLRWLADIGIAFWDHIKGTSAFPNWILYLLAITAIYTFVVLIKHVTRPKGPNVAEYTEDTFLGLIWRWSFTFNDHPANPWAFCPNCDTQLVYSHNYSGGNTMTDLTCETCNHTMLTHEGDKDYLVAKIHRQIDRKIRTGEWVRVVDKRTQHAG